jgi:hypothetical protein
LVLGDHARRDGLELSVGSCQEVGQGCAGKILRRQAQSLGFGSQPLGLRRGQFESQFHAGNVAPDTPSNKRLQPTAADAIMSRRG